MDTQIYILLAIYFLSVTLSFIGGWIFGKEKGERDTHKKCAKDLEESHKN